MFSATLGSHIRTRSPGQKLHARVSIVQSGKEGTRFDVAKAYPANDKPADKASTFWFVSAYDQLTCCDGTSRNSASGMVDAL